jgi:hypothetical protein
MIIRREQMDEITSARQAEYDRKLRRYFRTDHPEATAHYTDEQLLSTISTARERAPSWGIETGEGTKKFILMAVLISPTFDEHPDVRRYLKEPSLDPDYKIVALSRQVGRNLGGKN